MTIMTVIYILVGIIALCGLIGTVVFVQSWLKHGVRIAREELSNKDIEFINNYEYCPQEATMIKYRVAFNNNSKYQHDTGYLTTEEYRELPILELSEIEFKTPEEARDWFEKYEDTLDPNDNYNTPVIVRLGSRASRETNHA